MTEKPSDASTLGERLMDTPLIEAALVRAVQEALRLHKLAGNPIAEWRDGRVVWVAPEDIPVEQGEENDSGAGVTSKCFPNAVAGTPLGDRSILPTSSSRATIVS